MDAEDRKHDQDAQMTVLSGDPDAAGELYVLRFRTSADIRVAPHWHPEDEHITVIEGPFRIGFGDVFDETALRTLAAGEYLRVPKKERHFSLY